MTNPFQKQLSAFLLSLGQPRSSLASLLLLSLAAAGSVPSATSADVSAPLGLFEISDRSFPPHHMFCVSSFGSGQPLGCCFCEGDELCSGQTVCWPSPVAQHFSCPQLITTPPAFLSDSFCPHTSPWEIEPSWNVFNAWNGESIFVCVRDLLGLTGYFGLDGTPGSPASCPVPERFSCKIREVAQGFLQPGFENIHLQANREQQCCCCGLDVELEEDEM